MFAKSPALRWLSHHDLMRSMERALCRSGLPLYLTEGFNPRPKLSLPWPTTVGETASRDLLEFELTQPLEPPAVMKALLEQLPTGFELVSVERLAALRPQPVVSIEYRLTPPPGTSVDAACLTAAESRTQWLVERTDRRDPARPGKTLDVRPCVLSLSAVEGGLDLHLKVSPAGTARPAEVLRALGIESEVILEWKVDRKEVHLAKES